MSDKITKYNYQHETKFWCDFGLIQLEQNISMCSIAAMPAEIMLGHSPPVYSSLLYSPLGLSSKIATRSIPPRIRPCLSTGSLNLTNLRNDDNNGKQKKRVVFADDRGRPLTQVRVMSEPSSMPPKWSSAYFTGMVSLNNNIAEKNQENSNPPWQVRFVQPASDYLTFRQKLDLNNVSLENVIVREMEQCMVGTVKVRNLSYDKEVVVRTSNDSWKTHEDVHCTYVEQAGGLPALMLYDTFRFRLTFPLKSDTIEFCVKYHTAGYDYWDNNDGSNYAIRKHEARPQPKINNETPLTNGDRISNGYSLINGTLSSPLIDTTTTTNLRTWSEFAPWQHFPNDTPYW